MASTNGECPDFFNSLSFAARLDTHRLGFDLGEFEPVCKSVAGLFMGGCAFERTVLIIYTSNKKRTREGGRKETELSLIREGSLAGKGELLSEDCFGCP